MALKDYKESYYLLSGKASDISRQLGFAGIALIWIFKNEKGGQYSLPSDLLIPGVLIVASLALDLLHYVVSTATWGIFHRIKEKQGLAETADVKAPRFLNWLPLVMFWGKVSLMVLAYACLFRFIVGRIGVA